LVIGKVGNTVVLPLVCPVYFGGCSIGVELYSVLGVGRKGERERESERELEGEREKNRESEREFSGFLMNH